LDHELDLMSELWIQWSDVGAKLAPEQWSDPTRLTIPDNWDVKTLYSHHTQTVHRLCQFADCETTMPAEHRDAGSFFQQFNERERDKVDVSTAAREEADASDAAALVAVFRDKGPVAIQKARRAGNIVVQTDEGRIAFRDYVRNRLCESVVHFMDLEHALGAPASTIPPDAMKVACEVVIEMTDSARLLDFFSGRSSDPLEPVFKI